MSNIDEKNLRDFGKDSKVLDSFKNIKPSKEVHDKVWSNIESSISSKISSKNNKVDSAFISIKPYLAIAAILFISFIAILFFKDKNSLNSDISENESVIKIKMGGTIIPSKKSNFNIIESTSRKELVYLKKGKLDIYVIPTKEGEAKKHFQLQTKDGVVIVKGTKFKVTANDSGTDVLVDKGTVWVEPKGKGRAKIVLKKGASTHIKPLKVFLKEIKEDGIKSYINKEYLIAKEKLNKYILNKENDYSVITILARIAESEKRYTDAIKLYSKVVKGGTSLEQETAMVAIAVLLKNSGQSKKAKSMFLNYMKKFPKGVFKDDVYKELNKK